MIIATMNDDHLIGSPNDPPAPEMPELVKPMLARPSALPSDESNWGFEVKWDGVRAIAYSRPGHTRLLSRSGNDVTSAYPELGALNRALGAHQAILDGEIVAFDAEGRPSFEALQPRMHLRGEAAVRRLARTSSPVTYVLFDVLWLDGHSLMGLSYLERRARLDALELDGQHWRVPDFQTGEGSTLLAATRERGLEGILAKRLDSIYVPGRRGDSWLKIKHSQRQELVIGGWTEGKGSRSARIGALQLGVYDEQGRFRYAGRVGTGFDQQELERIYGLLSALETKDSPFAGRQPPQGAHFVKPRLVCEVEFTEWTKDGLLRHPSYKGLREDKPPTAVVRERAKPPPSPSDPPRPPARADPPRPPARADQTDSPDPPPDQRDPPDPSVQARETTDLRRLIDAGTPVRGGVKFEVDGRTLKLTNLDKVLYPKVGFTKADLIGYYARIAPVLLPHLRDRPLTLKRYPDGVQGEFFYEKQCPEHRPDWVQTTRIWSESSEREIDFCLCQDLPTLVWVANLAAIELHPSLSRAETIERPQALAFDLDPGPPASIVECCQVALELHDMFDELGLQTFAKTSGSKGLQVYVPLNENELSYEQTKPFARAVADLLGRRRPELVLSGMAKAQRAGKVFIDWSQNDEHKTTISVYSLRARELPTVSTPVSWEEVQRCLDSNDPGPLEPQTAEVLDRVRERGDLFAEVASLHQALPRIWE